MLKSTAVEVPSRGNLPFDSFSVREITVDVQADALSSSVQGYDVLILRVVGLVASGGSGRPVTRSIRIPASMFEKSEW